MTVDAQERSAGSSSISDDAFQYFQSLVFREIGVQLNDKAYLVESRLEPLRLKHDLDDINAVIDKMKKGDRMLAKQAVEAMTTNETSFFRDIHPFEELAKSVLPPLFERNPAGKVRIWNGACSSGQESYTLAMILHEHLPANANPRRVEIISTDVSGEMVKRTLDGRYSRFEVNRGLPADLAQKYFDQKGRQYEAKPMLKELITATELNLLGPWPAVPKCDVVLLRNVLIYFSPTAKAEILRRVRVDVLNPGGCLMLGASETTIGIDTGYKLDKIGRTTFYLPGAAT